VTAEPPTREEAWDRRLGGAMELGVTATEFWNLTSRELALYADARVRRVEREVRRDLVLAWHIAALSRSTKFPTLAELVGDPKSPKQLNIERRRHQREHEQLAEARKRGTRQK